MTPSKEHLMWWEKETISEISIARTMFDHIRETLLLPAPLMGLKTTVNKIISTSDPNDCTSVAEGIAHLRAAVTYQCISHSRPSGFQGPVSLGKRVFNHREHLPADGRHDSSGVSMSSGWGRSGRVLRNDLSFPYKSGDSSSPDIMGGREDIRSKEAEQFVIRELRGHCAPPIIPAPPIFVSSDFCNGSYEEFYNGLLEISKAQKVQEVLNALFYSFSEEGRKVDPQSYENAMTKAMNAIILQTSTTFGLTIPVKTYSSGEVTVMKGTLGTGNKGAKRDPDVLIFSDSNAVRTSDNPRAVKDVADWLHINSSGELKPENQPSVVKDAENQAFTAVRQVILHDAHRILEQAFTCCGGFFKFYYFDAKGYAVSEPYDIFDNPLLFINHVLLLSTFFTKELGFEELNTNYTRCDDLPIYRRVQVRGRRTTLYKVKDMHGAVNVEKKYWPTVRRLIPQEIYVYQHLEQMVKSGAVEDNSNLSRMLSYNILTLTAVIRRAFGVQSEAPRQYVQIMIDRHGMSIEDIMRQWVTLTSNDYTQKRDLLLKVLDAVIAAIGGMCYIYSGSLSSKQPTSGRNFTTLFDRSRGYLCGQHLRR
jgi:hypothetical protein